MNLPIYSREKTANCGVREAANVTGAVSFLLQKPQGGIDMIKAYDFMTDEEKQAMREYKKEWRDANRDKIAQYNKKFYQKQLEKRKKAQEAAANV